MDGQWSDRDGDASCLASLTLDVQDFEPCYS
jgi:hypothetical protein